MDYKHNKSLVSNAKNLRKNMTKEERHIQRILILYVNGIMQKMKRNRRK